MKTKSLLTALTLLTLVASTTSFAEERTAASDAAYKEGLSKLTIVGLGARATGNLVGAIAACGLDTIELAVTVVGDTLPLGTPVVNIGESLIGQGDNVANRVQQVAIRRKLTNTRGTAGRAVTVSLLGGAISALTFAVVESISNLGKLTYYKHATGVDYAVTRALFAVSYAPTEGQFMAAFGDKSSACRQSLWKIYQNAAAMSPEQVADAQGTKTAPAQGSPAPAQPTGENASTVKAQ